MSVVLTNWKGIHQQSRRISLVDQSVWVDVDPTISKFAALIMQQQRNMIFATSDAYKLLMDIVYSQIMKHILSTNEHLDEPIVQRNVSETLKLLPMFERLITTLHTRFVFSKFEVEYGPFRSLLVTDMDNPVGYLWTSIFAFMWVISDKNNMSTSDIDILVLEIRKITGTTELKIFAFICLSMHYMFGILRNKCMVSILERAATN